MCRTVLLLSVSLISLALMGRCSVADSEHDSIEVIRQQVDQRFEKLWAKHHVKPANPTDDATFLRRVSLDLTGTIPHVNQTRAFLKDQSPDKRQRLIQTLLETTKSSRHQAGEFAKAMLPNQQVLRPQLEDWLYQQLQTEARWDQIAKNIIAPTGENRAGQNYFFNSLERKPEKVADATARVFLGLQMGCAQCHDHPFGQWTRDEFWNYSAFFADVAVRQERVIFGKARVVEEANQAPKPLLIPDTQKIAQPQFPGTKTPLAENQTPHRERLAEWMTAQENPWFAKAAVNRVWSMLFGRGLVDPVDDLTRMKESPAQEVLELLSHDFAAHNYNLKRLLEVIARTRVYQLSSHGEGQAADRPELFSVMAVRSLTADQIYECLIQAVASRRATASQQQTAIMEKRSFVISLTAPTQQATEFQAGIPQMLTLLNGPLVARASDVQKCDLLAALKDGPFFTDDDRIEILYLSTLTRQPTEPEHKRAKAFLETRRKADSQGQELGDLLWVLLNSSEFLLNH